MKNHFLAIPCTRCLSRALLLVTAALAFSPLASLIAATYVIAISIDGMGSAYVSPLLSNGKLPNIAKLLAEGAGTLNARTDADRAVTLQNHVDMVTGRGVLGETGHS